MKRILLTLSVAASSLFASAQQDYQFTHYMYDNLSFNPGYAGITKSICATLIGRQQWAGFAGRPQTMLFNVHAPIKVLRGGIGISYINDQLGFEKNNLVKISYAYHQALGVGTLGIGVSAGFIQKSISANWITPDGTPAAQDASIAAAGGADLVPDINFGLFYKTNSLYMGISATHLGQFKMKTLNLQNVQHYWITAGYNYRIGGADKFILRPSVLAKTDAASTQIDLNVNLLFKKMVWAGVSYRLSDAIAPMLGYQYTFTEGTLAGAILKIGYAYDVTTSQLKSYSSGSHDIMVNFCFNLDKPTPIQKSKNPRFL